VGEILMDIKTGVTSFLKQSITTVKSPTWGETGPSWTTLYTNVPCRFVEESEWVRTDQAQEILTRAYLYVSASYSIKEGQELTINDQTYRVIRTSVNRDSSGEAAYLKVWVV